MGCAGKFWAGKVVEPVVSVWFDLMDEAASVSHLSYLWRPLSKSLLFYFLIFPYFIHTHTHKKKLPGVGWENYSCWAFCLDPSISLNGPCYSDEAEAAERVQPCRGVCWGVRAGLESVSVQDTPQCSTGAHQEHHSHLPGCCIHSRCTSANLLPCLFEFICSAFAKGRLKLSVTPTGINFLPYNFRTLISQPLNWPQCMS